MAKLRKWAPSVSTEDLKALWVHMDSNNSGEVTHHQLSLGLYRLELESWPDASAKQLQHTISEMNAAAKHWHRAPGNWYKLFLLIDTDDSGHIGFDELQSLIRGSFPSLSVSPQHISDEEIKALWKKLDEKRTSNANVQQFMSFMRKWGAEHSMHRLTSYSEEMRGISETMGRDIASEIAAAPALNVADLAAVTSRLAEMLLQWVVARGIGGVTLRSDATSPALWIHLLDHVVIDKSGRLTFSEFEDACKSILKVGKVATDDELKALWRAIDSNGSQEITPKEFGLGCYRIQVECWPSLEVAEIPRYIQILNRAVDKWHMCAGNWYKVFVKCDLNGSGDLDFEEWRNIVRRSFPGLSISSQELSEDSLRGLWRSIDDDLSSRATVKEFMLFMRQHEKSLQKSGIKQAQAVRKKQSLPSIARSREQLVSLAHHLQAALLAYWAKKGVHSDNRSCSWPQFFKDVGKDRSSRIPFDELEKLMTERMRHPTCTDDEVIKGVTRDDLIALYNVAIAGRTRLKEVAVKDWILCLYRIDIEEWPDYDSKNITRVVDIINEAGQRWHQAGGNWYKVFRRVYPDDSGTMTFEDFRGMCYNPLPCLSISSKCVREADLKALWKGLDQDRSGLTSVNEFMIFMRKHGTVQLHQSPGCKRARGQDTLARSRAEAEKIPGIDALSADHCALISRALGKESSETLAAAYSKWGIPWSGFVSEWDLLSVVRELLKISEDQMDDDTIYIIWRHLDSDGVGQVAVEEILQLADMLRCDTSA
jgi:Ca2+-binding EF-hand superfamily protein